MKRITGVILTAALLMVSLVACGSTEGSDAGANEVSAKGEAIGIAYQYGLAYAPLIVCKEQKLIEKAFKEATGRELEVEWNQMSSGADINTAFATGEIQAGFMGIAPAITGISKNVGYKIFTNLSGQEHGLMTNDSSLKSLQDIIDSDKQIALVNIGSIQHIILAKALSDNGYDAHELDAALVAMKHPDGMTSLMSGSIACHLTTNPYLYEERKENYLTEIKEISESWSADNTFIAGVASKEMYDENPDMYKALSDAIAEAVDYVNQYPDETASLTCEYNGNLKEIEKEYLQKGTYATETKGIYELAEFMYKYSFIDKGFTNYEELVFSNVNGD